MGLFWTILCAASLTAAAALFIAAAISDARGFRIPNSYCLALTALFPVYALTAPQPVSWLAHVATGAALLIVGYGLFTLRIAGAGDAKLIAAAGLWTGPAFVFPLLAATALAGGLLAVVNMMKLWVKARKDGVAVSFARIPLPYGIAIATGGVTALGLIARPLLTAS